jgi:hypothetical protein
LGRAGSTGTPQRSRPSHHQRLQPDIVQLERSQPGSMSSREIFNEYERLLASSQVSFNKLRDLPPYGVRWPHYFHKAFTVYSKLWKFQQQHR